MGWDLWMCEYAAVPPNSTWSAGRCMRGCGGGRPLHELKKNVLLCNASTCIKYSERRRKGTRAIRNDLCLSYIDRCVLLVLCLVWTGPTPTHGHNIHYRSLFFFYCLSWLYLHTI